MLSYKAVQFTKTTPRSYFCWQEWIGFSDFELLGCMLTKRILRSRHRNTLSQSYVARFSSDHPCLIYRIKLCICCYFANYLGDKSPDGKLSYSFLLLALTHTTALCCNGIDCDSPMYVWSWRLSSWFPPTNDSCRSAKWAYNAFRPTKQWPGLEYRLTKWLELLKNTLLTHCAQFDKKILNVIRKFNEDINTKWQQYSINHVIWSLFHSTLSVLSVFVVSIIEHIVILSSSTGTSFPCFMSISKSHMPFFYFSSFKGPRLKILLYTFLYLIYFFKKLYNKKIFFSEKVCQVQKSI